MLASRFTETNRPAIPVVLTIVNAVAAIALVDASSPAVVTAFTLELVPVAAVIVAEVGNFANCENGNTRRKYQLQQRKRAKTKTKTCTVIVPLTSLFLPGTATTHCKAVALLRFMLGVVAPI